MPLQPKRPPNTMRTPATPVRKSGKPDSPLEKAKRANGIVGYRMGGNVQARRQCT